MPRNLYRRVEISFPIESPALRKDVLSDILPAYLNDRVKARELQPDGSYIRLKPEPGEESSQAQLYFREQARRRNAAAPSANGGDHEHALRLTPLAKP